MYHFVYNTSQIHIKPPKPYGNLCFNACTSNLCIEYIIPSVKTEHFHYFCCNFWNIRSKCRQFSYVSIEPIFQNVNRHTNSNAREE